MNIFLYLRYEVMFCVSVVCVLLCAVFMLIGLFNKNKQEYRAIKKALKTISEIPVKPVNVPVTDNSGDGIELKKKITQNRRVDKHNKEDENQNIQVQKKQEKKNEYRVSENTYNGESDIAVPEDSKNIPVNAGVEQKCIRFCSECGKKVNGNFCSYCGHKIH